MEWIVLYYCPKCPALAIFTLEEGLHQVNADGDSDAEKMKRKVMQRACPDNNYILKCAPTRAHTPQLCSFIETREQSDQKKIAKCL